MPVMSCFRIRSTRWVTALSGVARGSAAADCVAGCVTARKAVLGEGRGRVVGVVTTGGGALSPLSRSQLVIAITIRMTATYVVRMSLPRIGYWLLVTGYLHGAV